MSLNPSSALASAKLLAPPKKICRFKIQGVTLQRSSTARMPCAIPILSEIDLFKRREAISYTVSFKKLTHQWRFDLYQLHEFDFVGAYPPTPKRKPPHYLPEHRVPSISLSYIQDNVRSQRQRFNFKKPTACPQRHAPLHLESTHSCRFSALVQFLTTERIMLTTLARSPFTRCRFFSVFYF